MALKIRLARGGSKKHPFYRIVVAEASSPRDGRFVERLGSYDPMVPKDHQNRVTLNKERISFWMSKGAKPTLRMHKILSAAGILDAPVIRDQPIKSAPGKKRVERENEAKEAALNSGALGCSISGSGPSIFALTTNFEQAEEVAKAFSDLYREHSIDAIVYVSSVNPVGAEVIS